MASNLFSKLQQLEWLRANGVGYYLSEQKSTDFSLAEIFQQNFQPKKEIAAVPNNIVKENSNRDHSIMTKTIITKTSANITSAKREPAISSDVQEIYQQLDAISTLQELKEFVTNFNGCELKQFALNTVFADGNPNAKILLIGEAPGASEDAQAIPFCGDSGKLLDTMLATVGISRTHNAYITNSIFWRPPANRKPTPQEIAICRPMVEKHISLIMPKLIILVGSTAVSALLDKNDSMNSLRTGVYNYQNRYISAPIATKAIFHPAYLLRQPMQKKATWFDLLNIKHLAQKLEAL